MSALKLRRIKDGTCNHFLRYFFNLTVSVIPFVPWSVRESESLSTWAPTSRSISLSPSLSLSFFLSLSISLWFSLSLSLFLCVFSQRERKRHKENLPWNYFLVPLDFIRSCHSVCNQAQNVPTPRMFFFFNFIKFYTIPCRVNRRQCK